MRSPVLLALTGITITLAACSSQRSLGLPAETPNINPEPITNTPPPSAPAINPPAAPVQNLLVNPDKFSSAAWFKPASISVQDNADGEFSLIRNLGGGTSFVNQRSSAKNAASYTARITLKGSGTVAVFLQQGGGGWQDLETKRVPLTANAQQVSLSVQKPDDGLPLQFVIGDLDVGEQVYVSKPELFVGAVTNTPTPPAPVVSPPPAPVVAPPPAPTPSPAPTPQPPPTPPPAPAPKPPVSTRVPWAQINSWGIQNHGFKSDGLAPIQASSIHLAAVGQFGGGGKPWTASEVNAVRANKWIIAYINVGSIFTFDPKWQPGYTVGNPSWLLVANTNWPGSYSVAYWNPTWQALVLNELDGIIDAGFDGIWMDQLDAYYNPGFPGGPSQDNVLKAVSWACTISRYAKSRKSDFKVVVNNAVEIINPNKYPNIQAQANEYLGCIDGMVHEGLWYKQNDQLTDPAYRSYHLPLMDKYLSTGKKVLTLEYTAQADRKNQVIDDARSRGYIPFVGLRELNLTPTWCDTEAKSVVGTACPGR